MDPPSEVSHVYAAAWISLEEKDGGGETGKGVVEGLPHHLLETIAEMLVGSHH